MTNLRPYQERSLVAIDDAHSRTNNVCCVLPTGGGKSVVGREWARMETVSGRPKGLVLAHRIELLKQFKGHLAVVGIKAGIVSPTEKYEPWLPVQCASLDTIVARGEVPEADWIIVDEAHHSAADTYLPVVKSQPGARILGLTATPQRSDGRPLGDIFGELVVGATYSELLKEQHLVPCKVHRPERYLGSDLAQKPLAAYLAHGEGQSGFVFCRNVKESKELAAKFTAAGVPSENIDGAMPASKREAILDRFRSGVTRLIMNVFVLTEGFDVPNATVCILARGAGHAGTYLQMVGRVLRPSKGKRYAIFIDLPGVSHEHGFPTADREYALEGRAIRTTGESLRNCKCGCVNPSSNRVCLECSESFPRRVYDGPKLWNLELLEYFENVGELDTAPKSLKSAEWNRLLEVCNSKSFGISFAVKEYERIFDDRPSDEMFKQLGENTRLSELRRLRCFQMERGLKVGFISHAYKDTFGTFPSRALRESAGVPIPEASAWAR